MNTVVLSQGQEITVIMFEILSQSQRDKYNDDGMACPRCLAPTRYRRPPALADPGIHGTFFSRSHNPNCPNYHGSPHVDPKSSSSKPQNVGRHVIFISSRISPTKPMGSAPIGENTVTNTAETDSHSQSDRTGSNYRRKEMNSSSLLRLCIREKGIPI